MAVAQKAGTLTAQKLVEVAAVALHLTALAVAVVLEMAHRRTAATINFMAAQLLQTLVLVAAVALAVITVASRQATVAVGVQASSSFAT